MQKTPIKLKKYSCYSLKKNHTRYLIKKKIPAARKFPTPHNFSSGPSLTRTSTKQTAQFPTQVDIIKD